MTQTDEIQLEVSQDERMALAGAIQMSSYKPPGMDGAEAFRQTLSEGELSDGTIEVTLTEEQAVHGMLAVLSYRERLLERGSVSEAADAERGLRRLSEAATILDEIRTLYFGTMDDMDGPIEFDPFDMDGL